MGITPERRDERGSSPGFWVQLWELGVKRELTMFEFLRAKVQNILWKQNQIVTVYETASVVSGNSTGTVRFLLGSDLRPVPGIFSLPLLNSWLKAAASVCGNVSCYYRSISLWMAQSNLRTDPNRLRGCLHDL